MAGNWRPYKEGATEQPNAWRNPEREGSKEKEEAKVGRDERKLCGPWAYLLIMTPADDDTSPGFKRHFRTLLGFSGSDLGFCYFQPKEPRLRTSQLASSLTSSPLSSLPSLPSGHSGLFVLLRTCSASSSLRAFALAVLSGMLFPRCLHSWLPISEVLTKHSEVCLDHLC